MPIPRNCALAVVFCFCAVIAAVALPASPQDAAATSQADGSAGERPVFRSRVNLVMVPVVVRDSHGNSIGDLRREDFQLLDDGKPQVIRHFAVERPEPREVNGSAAGPDKSQTKTPAAPKVPRRFIAWVIDDYHLGDPHAVRKAADRMLGELRPGDRVAIYSVSGVITVDFTDDIPALRKAISQLGPGEKFPLDRTPIYMSERELIERPFKLIRELVRVMSIRPGERSIVLVSDGWMVDWRVKPDLPELLDQAIRANVVINTLDTRGVYTLPVGATAFDGAQAAMQGDILEYLADGTGGVFFHSDNSMYEGFRRTTEAAEYRYILGFSPKEWHSDADFHRLKVKVDRSWVTVQARRGYSPGTPDGTVTLAGQQQKKKKNAPAPKDAGKQIPGASALQAESAPPASTKNSDEKLPTFRSQVNLVMVPVVVRDSHGNSIRDLRREDFQLLDNGKPQVIRHFAVERPEQRQREEVTNGTGVQKHEPNKPSAQPNVARRFIAWLIDDSQEPGMFSNVKLAVNRMVDELRPGDRVAVYLASKYEPLVDFTDDAAALRKAILPIAPWPKEPEADENSGSEKCLTTLGGAILPAISRRRGERSIVVVSPGFLSGSAQGLIDRAIQSNVVINTLDTRGVYTNFTFKVSNGVDAHGNELPEPTIQQKAQLAMLQSDILENLADGTGGVYFHSDNDLYEGLRRTTNAAEYRYILGFSPKEWHSEDEFHRLTVKVDRQGVTIQARRGYSPGAADGTVIQASQQKKTAPAQAETASSARVLQAETTPPASATGSAEKLPTFKSQVNLVMVPVVVRDSRGKALGNLKRDNFRVFDNGKQQKIKQFSVESAASRMAGAGGKTEAGQDGGVKASVASAAARRLIAYVFDDLHLDIGDLIPARKAAERQLAALEPGERVALYTTSGRNSVEFTDDTAKLREALLRMTPRAQLHECPDLGAYWAAQIDEQGYNTSNPVVSSAIGELAQCPGNSGMPQTMLVGMLHGAVSRILAESERDAQSSVALLRNVVSRMSALPGERTIVTVSPGFMPRHQEQQLAQVIERAVQARVVVNTLDARGVYTNSMFDASYDSRLNPQAMQVRMEMASLQADVLEELADGTGGLFFHSNNDMNEGFRKTAGVAEYTYMLGFTPELRKDPKADPYHQLKVKVEDAGHGLTVQARRSYRVDTEPADPLREQKDQIRMAMYSRAEMMDIPMKLNTEVAKEGTGEATLKLTVQLDLKSLPLRKEGDRNSDDLEVHAGVFDHNGKYVTGKGNRVELRLLDQTVVQLNSGGTLAQASNLGMDFKLNPGDYVVRVVVREAENQLMSAASSAVQIP